MAVETSIVIRTLNESKHLEKLMQGIHRQNYLDWEIVLVDSGSTDGTLDIAERLDLYERFTGRFTETVPAVVLHYPARTYAHPAALRGLSPGLMFEPASRFRDIHRWSIGPRDE